MPPLSGCWCWTSVRNMPSSSPAGSASSMSTARSCGTTSRRAGPRTRADGDRSFPAAQPAFTPRAPRSAIRDLFELGIPGAGDLLRHAARLPCAGREGRELPAARIRPSDCHVNDPRSVVRRRRPADRSLDEPRRSGVAHRGRFYPLANTPTCPFAAVQTSQAALLRSAVPPRGDAHPRRRQDARATFWPRLRRTGTWKLGDFAAETIHTDPRAGRHDRVICGLSGGVDSSVVAALLPKRSARSCLASWSTTACCGSTKRKR